MTALSRIALLATLAAACSGPAAPGDAGPDAPVTCASDDDCDDGRFCTGVERCAPGSSAADARGCAPAEAPPCAVAMCDEALDRCDGCDDDLDGDGVRSIPCGGTDCDDADANRFPGNAEVCDTAGADEDCDPETVGDRDADDDGAIDAACCNGDRCGSDCDDSRSNVHRLAPEVCDGFDNDCNGAIDEGVLVSSWPDADVDGWGDAAATPTMGCTVPTSRVDRGGDCDEVDREVHPFATERCNGVDDDCDTMIDEGAEAACESALTGSVAECLSGECVVVGCTAGRVDCNGAAADGCEADVCSDVASCDGCGRSCGGAGTFCIAGTCAPPAPFAAQLGTLLDASTGLPIAGATITLVGTCGTYSVTTDADGMYTVRADVGNWARIDAPGYPTHVQPRNAAGDPFGPIVSSARLDAWLATSGVTPDPARAIVVADHMEGSFGVLTPARVGARLSADADALTPGPGIDEVLLDAVPGRATIGGSFSESGCTTQCGPLWQLQLEPGTVTYVSGFECRTACS